MPTRTMERPPSQAVEPSADTAVRALDAELDRRKDALLNSAAGMVDPQRFRTIALATFTRTPKLWLCHPGTVARAIIEAAQLGLEPTGTLGGAYLVPYKGQCQLIVGYRGLVDLARRSGEIEAVEARIVREKDEFDFSYGLDPTIVHRPALEGDPGPMTHVYAIARYRSGGRQFDVMSLAEVEAIRQRSRAKDDGPWVTDYFEMAKKTVLRRLAKLLPLTVEAREVLSREDEWEGEARSAQTAVRHAEIRQRVRARLGAGTAESVADDTQEAKPAPEQGAPAPVDSGSAPAAIDSATCDSLSPYDPPSPCALPAGHPGKHRSGDKESW
jgi:recombination protein RecT